MHGRTHGVGDVFGFLAVCTLPDSADSATAAVPVSRRERADILSQGRTGDTLSSTWGPIGLSMAELCTSADRQQWEKVEVRRREPSRWGLVSGPLKPSSHAGCGHAMPNPAPFAPQAFFYACMQTLLRAGHDDDVKFRNPCAPLAVCRISEFLAAPLACNRLLHDILRLSHLRRMRECP